MITDALASWRFVQGHQSVITYPPQVGGVDAVLIFNTRQTPSQISRSNGGGELLKTRKCHHHSVLYAAHARH